jgi:hypothetical protein
MVPDAPATFSTYTVVFSSAAKPTAKRRPMASAEPPGGHGTMSLMGLSG